MFDKKHLNRMWYLVILKIILWDVIYPFYLIPTRFLNDFFLNLLNFTRHEIWRKL